MLVIHPDECIDCGVCEPECPVDAIKPDTEPAIEKWLDLNRQCSAVWPNITRKKPAPPDAHALVGVPDNSQSSSAPIPAKLTRPRPWGSAFFSL
jgi:ferredoxin